MEKVPVRCENVAENDTTGLVADNFYSLTVLLSFPKHRYAYIFIYMLTCILTHTRARMHTHAHTHAFSLGAAQHFFLPVGS